MRFRKIILLVFIVFALLIPFKFISAQDVNYFDLPSEKINPGSIYYPFKRLGEKVKAKFILRSDSKIAYQSKLLNKRIIELIYLTKNKQVTPIERSTQRFAAQAGTLSDMLIKNSNQTKNYEQVEVFNLYIPILNKLRDEFPANSSYWLLFQQDIDTLNILTEKLI